MIFVVHCGTKELLKKYLRLRTELKTHNNQVCPSNKINENFDKLATISSTCQSIPSVFCNVTKTKDNNIFPLDFSGNQAIANKCLTKN